jgi:hypothetical protein
VDCHQVDAAQQTTFALLDGRALLGPFIDVLAIGFNAYLDYYNLTHCHRASPTGEAVEVASQNIYYHALREHENRQQSWSGLPMS